LLELHREHHVAARRQIPGDVALHAPEQERLGEGPQALERRLRSAADGLGVALLEVAARAEEPRMREAEDAPELLEAVLHGRAAEGHAESIRLSIRDLIGRRRALALGVLDGLGFVQD